MNRVLANCLRHYPAGVPDTEQTLTLCSPLLHSRAGVTNENVLRQLPKGLDEEGTDAPTSSERHPEMGV